MKNTLRNYYKNMRCKLSPIELEEKSQAIFKTITNLSYWKHASVIMVYVSFGQEVMTRSLMEAALREGKKVIIPISNLETCTITPVVLTSFEDLVANKLGILELPEDKQIAIDPSLIDLCLIPGLSFDLEGHRLGFGKGYYDRFLPLLKATSPKIALAFECQISPEPLPYEDHDFTLDMICTEKKLYEISSNNKDL